MKLSLIRSRESLLKVFAVHGTNCHSVAGLNALICDFVLGFAKQNVTQIIRNLLLNEEAPSEDIQYTIDDEASHPIDSETTKQEAQL